MVHWGVDLQLKILAIYQIVLAIEHYPLDFTVKSLETM